MSFTVDDFPEELIIPIKALTDETRRKILLSLIERDVASYSQIQNGFQIKKGTLNHHLHKLVSAGLIRNFSIYSPVNPYNSYYAITDFGRKLVEGFRQTLEPKIVRRTMTFQGTATMLEEVIGASASQSEEKSQGEEKLLEKIAPLQNVTRS